MRSLLICVFVLLGTLGHAQSASPAIFRITTDEFWLNLHHFLYVLGRAEAKTSDSTRDAVAGAPPEAERGLKNLTADERRVWAESVAAYAKGLSLKDAVREAPMPAVTAALADAGDVPTLASAPIDAATREILERQGRSIGRLGGPRTTRLILR